MKRKIFGNSNAARHILVDSYPVYQCAAERNQDCDKIVAKAMYDLQEFCKGVERCLVECPHCSEADFCTLTIDGLIPAHWDILKEHIERLGCEE